MFAEARILLHITVSCIVKERCLKMNWLSMSHIAPLTGKWEALPRFEFLDALLFSEIHAMSTSVFSEEFVTATFKVVPGMGNIPKLEREIS
jgi:hypothetical protein